MIGLLLILTLIALGLTVAWMIGKVPGWAAVFVICIWMLVQSVGR